LRRKDCGQLEGRTHRGLKRKAVVKERLQGRGEDRCEALGQTQMSWTAVSGVPTPVMAPMEHSVRATTLTVIWNCRNRRMLSYTDLPVTTQAISADGC
jgi:hypothetical protein